MDSLRLKAAAVRKGMSILTLATTANIGKNAMYARMKNGNFKQNEILAIKNALDLSNDDLIQIFFAEDVS